MTEEQKKENENYFRSVLLMVSDGGMYSYPHEGEVYLVKGGNFYGTPRGVRVMKKLTPKSFHKHIRVKEKQ